MRRAVASLVLVALTACGSDPTDSPSNPLPSGSGAGGPGSGGSGADGGQGGVGATGGTGAASVGGGGAGATGGGGNGGSGGNIDCGVAQPGAAPELVSEGSVGRILLRGTILTPSQLIVGEVLVEDELITCVAASCAGEPGAADASVVETNGIILPGLIDAHNHVQYDIFDETDWAPMQTYTNHDQWTNEERYGAMVDAKQHLGGEGDSPIDLSCETLKYGELKGLVAGTTSMLGAAIPADKTCYGSLVRTIDQGANDLPDDKVQVATLFPNAAAANGVCANFADGDTDAWVAHVAEGVDGTALEEFFDVGTITTVDGCLYSPKTALIHATALGNDELDTMAMNDMSIVWSPRSNVFLYGGGSDLSKTTNIPLALQKGINVGLGPDWSLGGSQNMLDELRFANQVDNSEWGNLLDAKALVEMATVNNARALGITQYVGSIEEGKRADILVIGGNTAAPYDAVLAAQPIDVRLVLIDGVALYGDSVLQPLAPAAPGCETVDVGAEKFLCVAEAGGTAANKFGQTYAEITAALEQALVDYDALDLTEWDFAPLTPLVRCE